MIPVGSRADKMRKTSRDHNWGKNPLNVKLVLTADRLSSLPKEVKLPPRKKIVPICFQCPDGLLKSKLIAKSKEPFGAHRRCRIMGIDTVKCRPHKVDPRCLTEALMAAKVSRPHLSIAELVSLMSDRQGLIRVYRADEGLKSCIPVFDGEPFWVVIGYGRGCRGWGIRLIQEELTGIETVIFRG